MRQLLTLRVLDLSLGEASRRAGMVTRAPAPIYDDEMDVVVWALWIWIALSAVALVVYVFRRVRYNRRQRAAVLENKALPSKKADLSKNKKAGRSSKADRSGKKNDVARTDDAAKPLIVKKEPATAVPAAAASKSSASKSAASKPLMPRTIKAETEAKPTGPPIIFNNSTASTEAASTEPVQAEPVQTEPVATASTESAATEPATPFSMGSLLAPRTDEPATNEPATNEPATSPEGDAKSAPADDITLPVDEEPELNLATESVEQTSKTLADVLAGIRLPCDLLPVDEEDPHIADIAVTLVTMTASPDTVGASIADELERLGYEIFSLTDSEAVAKRGLNADGKPEDLLSLVIRTGVGPEGQMAGEADEADSDRSLPSAVAVDIWVGGDASPLKTQSRTRLGI